MEDEFKDRIKKLLSFYAQNDINTLLMVASGTELALKFYKLMKFLPLPNRYRRYLDSMWKINGDIVESLTQTVDHSNQGVEILPLSGFHDEFIKSLKTQDQYQIFEAFLNWEQNDLISKNFYQATSHLNPIEKALLTKPFIMKLNFYPWYYFQPIFSFDKINSRIENCLRGYKIADDIGWKVVFEKMSKAPN